jgi:hypothetical protein
MTDAEFARAFEAGTVPNAQFHHRDHVRLAWVYLSEARSLDDAIACMRAALQRFAAAAGKIEKYSDPVTVFWMREVAKARDESHAADFDALVRLCPRLLDTRLPDA